MPETGCEHAFGTPRGPPLFLGKVSHGSFLLLPIVKTIQLEGLLSTLVVKVAPDLARMGHNLVRSCQGSPPLEQTTSNYCWPNFLKTVYLQAIGAHFWGKGSNQPQQAKTIQNSPLHGAFNGVDHSVM